jgi:hypothetical protein
LNSTDHKNETISKFKCFLQTNDYIGFGTAGKNDYLKQHLNADLTKQCGGNQCSPGPYIQLKNVTDPRFHKVKYQK